MAEVLLEGTATPIGPVVPCTLPSGKPAECQNIDVTTCPNIQEPTVARLRTTEPAAGVTAGTVVFTTGGGGTSFYTNRYQAEALNQIMLPLLAAGYQLVEIRWPDPWLRGAIDGDLASPSEPEDWEGQAALACRVATVVRWVWDNKHPQGLPFCGTGNSGGASQLAYTLTHYGWESRWDAVVLTSGPTHSDIAHGCWATCSMPSEGCYPGRVRCGMDQAYGNPEMDCNDPGGTNYGPCQDQAGHDSSAPDMFDFQSIAVDTEERWDYSYPDTVVWFIEGKEDNSSAPWHMTRYFDELVEDQITTIGNGGGIEELDEVDHGVPAHELGAPKVFDALIASCVP